MLHWPWNLDEIILSTESKITLVSVIGWALSVTEEGTKIKIEQEFERCRFSVLIRVTNYHNNTDSYWEHMRKIKQCLDSQIILFVMINCYHSLLMIKQNNWDWYSDLRVVASYIRRRLLVHLSGHAFWSLLWPSLQIGYRWPTFQGKWWRKISKPYFTIFLSLDYSKSIHRS